MSIDTVQEFFETVLVMVYTVYIQTRQKMRGVTSLKRSNKDDENN